MPMYMGQAVSDEFLQSLIEAYREGQKSKGYPIEDGDQIVIDILADHQVMSPRAQSAFDLGASGA